MTDYNNSQNQEDSKPTMTYEEILEMDSYSQLKEDEKAKSNGVSRSSRTSQKDSTKNYSSRRGYSPRGI